MSGVTTQAELSEIQPEKSAVTPVSKPSRFKPLARRVVKVALIVCAAYYVFCLALLVVYRFVAPPVTGVQLERRVERLITRSEIAERKRYIAYSRLPAHVSRAVIVAEDGGFWRHWGFDFGEMRAASSQILGGSRPRGASTITQQLMKNLFFTTHRNPLRKVYDLALTPAAQLILGKRRILELYLNTVEWGPGVFGVDAAARHHYGVGARSLSRSQAAGLAALLPNPRRRTPETTSVYRAEILRRMARRGW